MLAPSGTSSIEKLVSLANRGAGLPSSRSASCRQEISPGGSNAVTSWSTSESWSRQRAYIRWRRPNPSPSRTSKLSAKVNQRGSSSGSLMNGQIRSAEPASRAW